MSLPKSLQEFDSLAHYKDCGYKPRFHGLGFIQLPIGSNRRIHLFGAPGFGPIIKDGIIHDHTWNMTSHILYGELHHVVYEFGEDPTGTQTLWPCAAKGVDGPPEGAEPIRGNVYITGDNRFPAGASYTFAHSVLHTITVDQPTITVIRKSTDFSDWPRAVADGDGPPDDAYPPNAPYTEGELWDALGDFLD